MISMKKIFNYLLIATLLIGTAVSFSSCKDDDKENENIPVNNGGGTGTTNGGGTGTTSSTYNIIGTWKCSVNGWTTYWTFNADGTGTWQEYETGAADDAYRFTYTFANNTIIEYYSYGTETTTIRWVDKNHFIDEDDDHWYRQ